VSLTPRVLNETDLLDVKVIVLFWLTSLSKGLKHSKIKHTISCLGSLWWNQSIWGLNFRFDMSVVFKTKLFYCETTSLSTMSRTFMNLKIKSTHFSDGDHRDKTCVLMLICMSTHAYTVHV
jgi:hypothetical protein